MFALPESSAELVVVHVWLRLPLAPFPRHLVRIGEFELPIGALPVDDCRVGRVREQLQEELPQLDLPGPLGYQAAACRIC